MAGVKLNRKDGKGSIFVDGVDISRITSQVNLTWRGGQIPAVDICVAYCAESEVVLDDANITVRGIEMPASVEMALYAYLKRKHDQIDVTALSDDSKQYALRSE